MHNLLEQFHDNLPRVKDWMAAQNLDNKSIIYSSVDLRYSGEKLAPIDVNIFPAGFNNLNVTEIKFAKNVIKEFIELNFPHTKTILLIAENHTRNLYYLDNIYALTQILEGYEVVISNINITQKQVLTSHSNHELAYHPLKLIDNFLVDLDDNPYDLVILNNDLSLGLPPILKDIKNNLTPSLKLGWYNRLKSNYFLAYDQVINQLAHDLSLDLSVLKTQFTNCDNIDFQDSSSFEELKYKIELMLKSLEQEYSKLGISSYQPYLFVKAQRGTYGMGIMTINNILELDNINRKIRKKMNVIKEGLVNSSVIIQEGIPTINTYQGFSCEPMVYLVNHQIIANFSRVNISLDKFGNLNSQGMFFTKTDYDSRQLELINVIAQLASMAINYELKNLL